MNERSAREYLERQRIHEGRPAALAFPMVYPREILTALDILSWERWYGPPGGWGAKDPGRLQGYICPIARGLQGIIANGVDSIDVVIIPHTCDSLQGLGSLVTSRPAWGMRAITFRLPRGTDRDAARRFLRGEVERFARAMEEAFDRKLEPARLHQAVLLHRDLDRALSRLLASRPRLLLSDEQLYDLLEGITYLHPREMLERVESLIEQLDGKNEVRGLGVVVSGIVPQPDGFFEALSSAGLYVAADDYALLGRRISAYDGTDEADPLAAVTERLLWLPPCPTRSADVDRRTDRLIRLARRAGARGVILHTVRSCEPELFDVPTVRRGLEDAGFKVLHLETEIEPAVTGQMQTRLEAFAELLDSLGDA